MANEYLKRTPTSSGNRRVFTWAGWVKLNNQNTAFLFTSSPAKDNNTQLFINSAGQIYFFNREGSDATTDQIKWEPYFRDMGSWKHVIINADTTQASAADRVRCYVNGVLLDRDETQSKVDNVVNVDTLPRDQQFWRLNGSGYEHYIGASLDNSLNTTNANQFTDVFYVDGQQLGPDVFGFYKDGDGYVSAGSTQATDFRPGQWVPHSPSIIKKSIERRGGFGVNGFYLPMNDSSNVGADFHTTPNSIITLKGEDLPQPRNGAPTTTDAYVSQLRSDPYAANLVLAVPGISTSTSANLVSNGTFDSNVSGWTAVDATLTWSNGKAQTNRTGGSGYTAYQAITGLVSGQRYTLSGTIDSTGTGNRQDLRLLDNLATSGGSILVSISGTNNQVVQNSGSFTATGTTHYVYFVSDNSGTGFFDNIVVKQEDAPRDYSADIKGSGTNKTLTANGNAGVGYEIPSYYGSAMTFDGTGDYFTVPASSDLDFGTGDFTAEFWLLSDSTNSSAYRRWVTTTSGAFSSGTWVIRENAGANDKAIGGLSVSSGNNAFQRGQWNHIAWDRYGTVETIYVNGVSVGINTNSTANYNEGATNGLYVGGFYSASNNEYFDGYIQDLRVYKGVAKYKGGFDVPKPYTPVGFEGDSWRTTADTCKNNFATLNPLVRSVFTSGDRTISNGNLTATTISTGAANGLRSTIATNSGKWYAEVYVSETTTSTVGFIGVTGIGEIDNQNNDTLGDHIYYYGTAQKYDYVAGTLTSSSYGSTYTAGDIISVLINADNGEVTFYKNNVSQGVAKTFPSSKFPLVLHLSDAGSAATATYHVNFGQNPSFSGQLTPGTFTDSNGKGLFKYEPPSGFLALCEDNLPTPAIKNPGEYFKTVLYTGSGSSRGIVGVGFTPDLVWVKSRINPTFGIFHTLVDSVRGAPLALFSNSTDSEDSPGGVSSPASVNGGISSFDNDGFSIMSGSSVNFLNISGTPYVAWCWKAGGPAVTNNDGTIASQVSVNQTAGFSIVSYTGDGSNPTTVGHGLTKAPKFILFKCRTHAVNWFVYHGFDSSGAFEGLNTPNIYNSGLALFNQTAPTSSVINLGSADSNISGRTYIAYCWAEIEGFSKFGSYVGNQSADGPFVYCGFKPAWLMVKNTDTGSTLWLMADNARFSTNPINGYLHAESSADEYGPLNGDAAYTWVDFLSNGFKLRQTGDSLNKSGDTYIFAAFAESPFQTANAK